jgi:hypothetical protein
MAGTLVLALLALGALVLSVCALRRAATWAVGRVLRFAGVLAQPSHAPCQLSVDTIVHSLLDQLEHSDLQHAYVADGALVYRIDRSPDGWRLVIGDGATTHADVGDLLRVLGPRVATAHARVAQLAGTP